MNELFQVINAFVDKILFFDIFFEQIEGVSFPFVVAWLILGGVYLTIKMGFVNLHMFAHSFAIVRGKFRTKEDKGLITPFQSLATALSATVGIGNIAAVSIAISLGGAGAAFWMIIAGFLGMTLKFTEVTLSVKHREFLPDGTIMGGGMEYLSRGLAQKGMHNLGKILAIIFAFFMIFGALGAGNLFQISQSVAIMQEHIPFLKESSLTFGLVKDNGYLFGLFMAIITGLVIIGGIKRIAQVAAKIVPLMVIFYLLMVFWVLGTYFTAIPDAFALIFTEAFSPTAVAGGMLGAMIQGFQRAVFSNEAGLGSAGIAHSTAKVKYPVRQGLVSLYEPFIDTVVVCTMTALVVILTGSYLGGTEALEAAIVAKQGAVITSTAFGSVVSWFSTVLGFAIFMFAFSTMVTWSYYGERAWVYLFGTKSSIIYKLIFLAFIVIATITETETMVEFSSILFLALAVPNIIGLLILSGDVKEMLQEYLTKLKSGEFDKEAIRD
ncbi:MAG: Na(+)-linked D-alanine glycine permease [uncultured Sulfurovum sp.]|uniref:Na(+)-linked D-alanine glycine permease n=1 Tax=uncultured Sulfurovum sp. TaxID=269237 RepID=A0A6S6T2B1_9BACT|nr:MAG: Na(+)-linked D-alanine glycine permease [uncultured Sulfurovum sp.]